MSRDESGIVSRFVTTTLPVKWPKSRRQAYQTIRNMGVYTGNIDKTSTFRKWTIEGPTYTEINRALLNDDLYTLQKHVNYINDLHRAIKENCSYESIKVYRGLRLDEKDFHEIYTGMVFLWPTFTSTSCSSTIARGFGPYIFEIDASPNDGTYRANISSYSAYPAEQEVLFYPYSGFRVKNIFKDTRVIQLECVDTVRVESTQNSPVASASIYNPTPTLGTPGFSTFGNPGFSTFGNSDFSTFGRTPVTAIPTPRHSTPGFSTFGNPGFSTFGNSDFSTFGRTSVTATPTPRPSTPGFSTFGNPGFTTFGNSDFSTFGRTSVTATPTPRPSTPGGFYLAPPTSGGIRLVTPPGPHTHGTHCLRFHTPGTCGPNCNGVHCTFNFS